MEYKFEQSLLGHQKGVRSITYVNDATYPFIKFASGGDMGEVIVWKLSDISFEPFIQYIPHNNTVMCLVSTFDKKLTATVIYSSGRDSLIVKSTTQGVELLKLKGHGGPVCSLSLVEDKNILLSGSWDGSAIVWNLESSSINYKIDGFQYGVYPYYSKSNGHVYLGSQNGHITVWEGPERVDVNPTAHKDAIRTVRVYDQTVLTCSNDMTVKTFNLKLGDAKEFTGHTSFVYDAHITNNGLNIVSSSEDCTVIVWDIESLKAVQTITHPSTVWQISSFETRLLTACQDGKVRIYNNHPDFVPNPDLVAADSVYAPQIQQNVILNNGKNYYKGDQRFPPGNYDYIFQVEQNGVYYSLPYNNGDNPASVAEKFCLNAGISSNSAHSITEFIRTNIPQALPQKKIISVPSPLSFSEVPKDKLLNKIKELNDLITEESAKLSAAELESVKKCLDSDKPLDDLILTKLYLWPEEHFLPVLDFLRVLPLKSKFNVTPEYVKTLLNCVESHTNELHLAIALKAISNSLYLTVPRMKMENHMPQFITTLTKMAKTPTLRIQQPLSVIALNYSHVLISRQHLDQRKRLLNLVLISLDTCRPFIDHWGLSVSNRLILTLYKLYTIDTKIVTELNDSFELLLFVSDSFESTDYKDSRSALAVLLGLMR